MLRYKIVPLLVIFTLASMFPAAMHLLGAQEPVKEVQKNKSAPAQPAPQKKTAKKAQPAAPKPPQQKKTAAKAPAPTPKKKQSKQGKQQPVTAAKPAKTSTGKKKISPQKAVAPAQPAQPGKRTIKKRRAPVRAVARPQIKDSRKPSQKVISVWSDAVPFDRQISAKSAMVMNADTGETIYAKAPDNPRQPASTIKIVTALIALKTLRNDDIITVSRRAADMPSSKIFLDPKRNYRANDLINAVLLASANDASVALGESIAGSEEKFANTMTVSARMWGAQNTFCRTASGLSAEGQQSTARDLATLFRYAMQHDEFAQRMRVKKLSTSYGKTLLNHNKALWRIDGAVGGKTGYTVAARQTYVGQFTRNGKSIVVSIMGSESMWADLKKLVEYGFRQG